MNAQLEAALRKSFETLTREEMLDMLIILMDEGLHSKAERISKGHRRKNTANNENHILKGEPS